MKTNCILIFGLALNVAFIHKPVYSQDDQMLHGRKILPANYSVANLNQEHDDLKCGATYSIPDKGHQVFKINSKTTPCSHTFLGSNNDKCTAAIYCTGNIDLANPSENDNCPEEYFTVTDGSEGSMSSCGTFSFDKSPRCPRSKGKDLYVSYKGKTVDSKCIVFCLEDLENSAIKEIKNAKPLPLNPKWNGYQMDKSCVCGRKNVDPGGRIVGGTNAVEFEFPCTHGMAAVVPNADEQDRVVICGAVLLNNLYVLTAAHCFVKQQYSVDDIQVVLHTHVMDKPRLDDYSLPSDDDPNFQNIPGWSLPTETDQSENSIRSDVEEIINHPLYTLKNYDYDISLLKLKTKVNLSSSEVSPICLPKLGENFKFEDGETMLVAGWGRPYEGAKAGSRILQKLEVPFVKTSTCKPYMNHMRTHFCAGHLEGMKDSCQGDSGGPLIRRFNPSDNLQYMLAGLVNYGKGCARMDTLGLYADVQELLQWIYDTMDLDETVWCER